ncbi:MAG TPA: hypothetical protein PK529_09995, partial [Verrucomicrobiales bacterium]|nr:hypothetical protein [Verrucomicrobiales bacterium]
MEHSVSRILISVLGASLAACAGPAKTLSLSSYRATSGDESASWKGLEPGTKYLLFAPTGSCQVAMASSLSELEQGKGTPVAGTPAGTSLSVVEIRDAYVRTGSDAFAAIEVQTEAGAKHWLKLPAGASHGCLQPVPAGLEAARALVGKSLVFTPWAPGCSEVQATGRAPGSM